MSPTSSEMFMHENGTTITEFITPESHLVKEIYPRVVAVIVARDEEDVIEESIRSLQLQTHKILNIVVGDDGLTDGTPQIVKEMGCSLVSLPYHQESLIGNPQLASKWNIGYKQAELFKPDYILTLGADHSLPSNYVEELLKRMNDKIVVSSGRVDGELFEETMPRGSGRLIDVNFWNLNGGLRYPIVYGWESYILYKAQSLGFETRSFRDIVSKTRKVSGGARKAVSYGRAMKELGYWPFHAIARSLLLSLKNPREGYLMAINFLKHSNREQLDITKYVNEHQKKRFKNRLWKFIRNFGRR